MAERLIGRKLARELPMREAEEVAGGASTLDCYPDGRGGDTLWADDDGHGSEK